MPPRGSAPLPVVAGLLATLLVLAPAPAAPAQEPCHEDDPILLADLRALAGDPHDPDALARLAEAAYDERAAFALLRAADEALPASRSRADGHRFAAWLLQERIVSLFELGLTDRGLAELESAPAHLRRLLLAGGPPAGPVFAGADPPVPEIEIRDLRLALAAAYLLAGDLDTAHALVAALPPQPPDAAERAPTCISWEDDSCDTVRRRLALDWLLASRYGDAEPPPDAEVFEHFLRGSPGGSLWSRLDADLALDTGYPEVARYLLAVLGQYRFWTGDATLQFEACGGLPAGIRMETDRLLEELREPDATLQLGVAALGASQPWVQAPGWSRSWWRRWIDEEKGSEVEVPLPPGGAFEVVRGRATGALTGRSASHLDPSEVALPLPDDRAPVAVLHSAGESYLITHSTRNPAFSRGDHYLLFATTDGGGTWRGPYPTGIEIRSPFEIVAGSTRNRVSGDRLELDVVAVGWYPGLPFPPAAQVRLEVPLTAVLGDRDGDGMPDLAERVAGTDPTEADSDGDGIEDPFDRLTGRTPVGRADPDTEAVVARTIELALRTSPAPELHVHVPSDRPLPVEDTVYVLGAGMPLGALRTPDRVVLLEEIGDDEGRIVLGLELLVFDASRTRAMAAWRTTGGGRGGSAGRYTFERAEDGSGAWRVVGGFEHRGCFTTPLDADRLAKIEERP